MKVNWEGCTLLEEKKKWIAKLINTFSGLFNEIMHDHHYTNMWDKPPVKDSYYRYDKNGDYCISYQKNSKWWCNWVATITSRFIKKKKTLSQLKILKVYDTYDRSFEWPNHLHTTPCHVSTIYCRKIISLYQH